jgi:hypothetical protein
MPPIQLRDPPDVNDRMVAAAGAAAAAMATCLDRANFAGMG